MSQHYATIVLTETPADFELESDVDAEFYRIHCESVGIDDMRTVITEAHRRPKEGFSLKNIILSGLKITSEAQQAALKILEETPENISLTLVFPIGTQFLDTIKSRVQIRELSDSESSNALSEWLSMSLKERLSEVEVRLKNKDSIWMQEMKSGVQTYCKKTEGLSAAQLREVQLVLDNVLTRGASNKMLFEHLALTLPLTR